MFLRNLKAYFLSKECYPEDGGKVFPETFGSFSSPLSEDGIIKFKPFTS
jgi:hypothetical protein